MTVGKPFSIIQRVRNTGRGTHTGGVTSQLQALGGRDLAELGPSAAQALPVGTLQPGEETALVWQGLAAKSPGDWLLATSPELRIHVFAEEIEPPQSRTEDPVVVVERNGDIRAIVANAWSRLSVVVDEDDAAYALSLIHI